MRPIVLSMVLSACRTAAAPTSDPPQLDPDPGPGCPASPDTPVGAWTTLAPGVEHAWFRFDPPPELGCNRLDVVRIDPSKAHMVAYLEHVDGLGSRTARDWCGRDGSIVVTNLGMYHPDGRHVGYQRRGDVVDPSEVASDYRSVLVSGPRKPGLPGADVVDLEGSPADLVDWDFVSQNLRLIAEPGRNMWAEQDRRWSEAALGQDGAGRILLLHTRAAFSMAELNRRLLALPLDVRQAMHLDGGPPASLSICAPAFELDVAGGFETGVFGDSEVGQWELPNVLAVVP